MIAPSPTTPAATATAAHFTAALNRWWGGLQVLSLSATRAAFFGLSPGSGLRHSPSTGSKHSRNLFGHLSI